MDQLNNILNAPAGMKSYLPQKALGFEKIKNKINEIFKIWGYTPIITPVLENYNSLITGMGQDTKKEFYKLIDYEGNILALRPEMTAPIARTVVNRMDELELPLRLSYYAPVFRYDSPQMGKNREIHQMGLEYIGENIFADAEAIIIAIESIKNTGIKNFKIDLGHTDYLNGILNKFNLNLETESKVKKFLNKKDFVGFRGYVDNLDLDPEDKAILKDLPLLRGKKSILNKARTLVENQNSLQAIDKLEDIYSYLVSYEVEDYVNFDLSLMRGMDYYTGMIFEGFTEKLGYTICGGGRYDNLIKKYGGVKIPAVGFAMGIQRISLALEKSNDQNVDTKIDGVVVFDNKNRKKALEITRKLHKKGFTIIIRENKEMEELMSKFKRKNVNKIISFIDYKKDNMVEVIEIPTLNKKKIILEEGWENQVWVN
ncbi:MAG: ATP phosphoribosyltransferase regulatory subunit [Bacillota bacterium]